MAAAPPPVPSRFCSRPRPDLSPASPVNLPRWEPGSTNTVDLLLSPGGSPPGNYNGEAVLRSDNALLRVPFTARAVSEARGNLQVTAEDEYTYFAEGSPLPDQCRRPRDRRHQRQSRGFRRWGT